MDLGLHFLKQKDSFLSDKDFSVFTTQNNSELSESEIKSAISSIFGAAKNAVDLDSCLAAIKGIKKYLSHSSDKVKNIACEIMSSLIGKVAIFLSSEADPKKLIEAGEFLIEMIDELSGMNQNGSITMSANSMHTLSAAKKIIGNVLEKVSLANHDEFISSKDQNNQSSKQINDCITDKFISSTNNKNNLVA